MSLISSDLNGVSQERRHVALYIITGAALQSLFTIGNLHNFYVKEGIPEGAQLVGAEWSPSSKAVLLYFEHEDFSEVWETTASVYEYPIRIEVRSD